MGGGEIWRENMGHMLFIPNLHGYSPRIRFSAKVPLDTLSLKDMDRSLSLISNCLHTLRGEF